MTHTLPGLKRSQSQDLQHGFTLVELLVSAIVLLIAVGGTATLFSRTNAVSSQTNRRYSLQASIDQDIANIQRLNDRYTCVSGTSCVIANSDPSKTGYFPTASNATQVAYFTGRCDYSAGDLVTQLVTLINSNVTAPSGVTRTIDSDGANGAVGTTQGGVHRYRVTYVATDTSEHLRTILLVPTAVSWCP